MSARELAPEERRERGTRLCRDLCEEVARIVPEGIGAWSRAWEITAPSDAAFIVALDAWEAEPSPERVQEVREAWDAVLDAWRHAATLYREREGAERSCPDPGGAGGGDRS